jgi:hypothetical protein
MLMAHIHEPNAVAFDYTDAVKYGIFPMFC